MSKGQSGLASLILTFLVLSASPILGQAQAGGDPPSHVSVLRIWNEGQGVHLSWVADPGQAKGYVVYRSLEPPSEASLPGAVKIAELPPEAVEYVETENPGGAWYYFLLSVNETGEVVKDFVVAQNATRLALTILSSPAPSEPVPEAVAEVPSSPVQEVPAPEPPEAPVTPVAIEEEAAPSPKIEPVPEPGPAMAPAVVKAPEPEPEPSVVAPLAEAFKPAPAKPALTQAPASVPSDNPGMAITQRESPLPSYRYPGIPSRARFQGNSSQDEGPLSVENQESLERLLDGRIPNSGSMPDLALPEGAQEEVWDTVRMAMENGDWSAAKDGLDQLGAEQNSQLFHWFQGVCLANLGDYREALYELIPRRDDYPRETKPWIDFCLLRLSASR